MESGTGTGGRVKAMWEGNAANLYMSEKHVKKMAVSFT